MSMQKKKKKKIQFQSERDFKDEKETKVCRMLSTFFDRLTTP